MQHIIRCPPMVVDISPCCRYHSTYQMDYTRQASQRYGFYRPVEDANVCERQTTICDQMCEPQRICCCRRQPPPVEWVAVANCDLKEPRIMPLKISPEQQRSIELVVVPNCVNKSINRFYANSMSSNYPQLHMRIKHEEEMQKYAPPKKRRVCACISRRNLMYELPDKRECAKSQGHSKY